jgi:hypothetical protein
MPSSERSTTQGPALPSYRELPVAEGGVHSGWHVFGADDNRGLMNLITPEVTLRASSTVRRGAVFPLDVPTGYVSPPLFSRGAPRHTVLEPRPGRTLDDVHDNVYPQSGSQWDSLGHAAFLPGQFYNGATTEQVKSGVRNTIEHWARSGIATRGIVLDVSDAVAERGGPGASVAVTVEDLENARIRAQVEYRPPYLPDMDDLEDELASVAGLDAPTPEPSPEPTPEPEAPAEPVHAHPSPHSGWGTEPDGGTEVT